MLETNPVKITKTKSVAARESWKKEGWDCQKAKKILSVRRTRPQLLLHLVVKYGL